MFQPVISIKMDDFFMPHGTSPGLHAAETLVQVDRPWAEASVSTGFDVWYVMYKYMGYIYIYISTVYIYIYIYMLYMVYMYIYMFDIYNYR